MLIYTYRYYLYAINILLLMKSIIFQWRRNVEKNVTMKPENKTIVLIDYDISSQHWKYNHFSPQDSPKSQDSLIFPSPFSFLSFLLSPSSKNAVQFHSLNIIQPFKRFTITSQTSKMDYFIFDIYILITCAASTTNSPFLQPCLNGEVYTKHIFPYPLYQPQYTVQTLRSSFVFFEIHHISLRKYIG